MASPDGEPARSLYEGLQGRPPETPAVIATPGAVPLTGGDTAAAAGDEDWEHWAEVGAQHHNARAWAHHIGAERPNSS